MAAHRRCVSYRRTMLAWAFLLTGTAKGQQDLYIHIDPGFNDSDTPVGITTIGLAPPPPYSITPGTITSSMPPNAATYVYSLGTVDPSGQNATTGCTLGMSGWTLTVGNAFTITPDNMTHALVVTANKGYSFNLSPVPMYFPDELPGYQVKTPQDTTTPQGTSVDSSYTVSGTSGSHPCSSGDYGSNALWLTLTPIPPLLNATTVSSLLNMITATGVPITLLNVGSSVQDPPGGFVGKSLTITSTKPLTRDPNKVIPDFTCNSNQTCFLPVKEAEVSVNIYNPYRALQKGSSPPPPGIETLTGGIAHWKITAYPQLLQIEPSGSRVKLTVPGRNRFYHSGNAKIGYSLKVAIPNGSNKAPLEARPRAILVEWRTGLPIIGQHHQLTIPCDDCQLSFGPNKK